jgi:hypothetical protein
VLVHETHTIHHFAVVCVIFVGEDIVEQSRAKTIEIQQELPGLVPACELSDVARGAVEGTREIMQRTCDGAAMLMPEVVALKYGPGPSGPIVWLGTVHHPMPKRD